MTSIWQDELSVGNAGMDHHHRTFLDLLARLNEAPPAEWADLYPAFLEHLAEHFEYEEQLMAEHGYGALKDHRAEHLRVLAEARDLARSLARGRTALLRSYLSERMPEWFLLHRNTMDLAAAVYLRERGVS